MSLHDDLEDLAPSADLSRLVAHRVDIGCSSTCGDGAEIDEVSADGDSISGELVGRLASGFKLLAPGLLLVAGSVATAFLVTQLAPSVSPLVASVAIGAALTNVGLLPDWARPGTRFAAKRLLRLGVVLLGFQLAISDLFRLGGPGLAIVVLVVTTTFFGTRWLGEKLGVSSALSLLIATGFSICGASAVAAVDGVAGAEEEETAFAIALVTLCGSLAIVVLPALAGPLGLSGSDFGAWTGASVHDIAQVVAAASTGGRAALDTAVIVKLTRIILLAPMVAGVTIAQRRQRASGSNTGPANSGPVSRTPILPLFIVGFLGAVALRSTNVMPILWLNGLKTAETLALCAALVGLGSGVKISKLRRLGGRPLILAMTSWLLIASVAYVGVRLVGV
ncbi:MAG TPA: putative sulfate exporter family transporter [Microthrixaceae bacterium]|nr:putative sulfate exporter family transporter [Microthrixaceae bacterium]